MGAEGDAECMIIGGRMRRQGWRGGNGDGAMTVGRTGERDTGMQCGNGSYGASGRDCKIKDDEI